MTGAWTLWRAWQLFAYRTLLIMIVSFAGVGMVMLMLANPILGGIAFAVLIVCLVTLVLEGGDW